MTEKEAAGKWCPMARIENGRNLGNSGNLLGTCMGSRCMMWRWDSYPNPDCNQNMLRFPQQSIPMYLKSETDGHCGMAHG